MSSFVCKNVNAFSIRLHLSCEQFACLCCLSVEGTRNREELIALYLKQLSSLASSKASVPWPWRRVVW